MLICSKVAHSTVRQRAWGSVLLLPMGLMLFCSRWASRCHTESLAHVPLPPSRISPLLVCSEGTVEVQRTCRGRQHGSPKRL